MKTEDPAERHQTHFRGVQPGHETKKNLDGGGGGGRENFH